MGRRAQGWQLRKVGKTWYVRFSHGGRQREFSTGTGDKTEALAIAAQRYSEVVSGRRIVRAASAQLVDLLAAWLVEYRKDHAPKTADMAEMYARAHWLPFFGDVSRITNESCEDYARERLTSATRVTVRKEMSGLRKFAAWAGIDVIIPGLPKHGHPGKRHKYARKPAATVLAPAQMERLLRNVPVARRDFFRVLWETGLRQSTVFRLKVPVHYKRGAKVLFIGRDIEKAHAEGELDLTPKARAALKRAAPDTGTIFRRFDLRAPLRTACTKARVPLISPYDIRHSRLTAWANQPGITLPGFMGAARHTSLATSARYVKAQREETRRVILGGILGGGGAKDGNRTRKGVKPART